MQLTRQDKLISLKQCIGADIVPKFNTQWNHKQIITTSGDKFQTIYGRKRNHNTETWEIYIKDTIPIYEEIQEASEGASLKEMILKYGENEIISRQKEWQGLDTTQVPIHKLEKLNLMKSNEKEISKKMEKLENDRNTARNTRHTSDNIDNTTPPKELPKDTKGEKK